MSSNNSYLPDMPTLKSLSAGKKNKGMTESQINIKILLAGVLTISVSFLVSLAQAAVPKLTIYAYLFTVANFAGYTVLMNRGKSSGRSMPIKPVSAVSVMISAGFTVATALSYSPKVAVTETVNIVVYFALFLLLSLMLLPEQVIDKIEP